MVVFEHTYSEVGSIWKLKRVIQLTDMPDPCGCILQVASHKGKSIVLVGCGNKVVTINPIIHDKEPQLITVPCIPEKNQYVINMIHRKGFIWCVLSKSVLVFQFRLSDYTLTATLNCDISSPTLQSSVLEARRLSLPNPIKTNVAKNVRKVDLSADDAKRKVNRVESVYETTVDVLEVRSLLAMKDTLWVGRSAGDILVVSLDGDRKIEFGEVIAVLTVDPIRGQDKQQIRCVQSMFKSEYGDVVAISNVFKQPNGFGYEVALWNQWGSNEFAQFVRSVAM